MPWVVFLLILLQVVQILAGVWDSVKPIIQLVRAANSSGAYEAVQKSIYTNPRVWVTAKYLACNGPLLSRMIVPEVFGSVQPPTASASGPGV